MVKVGLINNRHPMPVQNYIFEKEIENVFDFESIKNEIKEFILEKVGVHTVLNHGINQTDSQSVSVYSGKMLYYRFVVCNSCTCTSVCCVWSGINFNAL